MDGNYLSRRHSIGVACTIVAGATAAVFVARAALREAFRRAWRNVGESRRSQAQSDAWRSVWTSLMEGSGDAIVAKDLNGIVTYWNSGAERMFGYRAEEIVGKSILVLFPKERLPEEASILERLKKGEVIDHYETVRRAKDGRLIDVSLGVAPVRDSQGRIVGASKIARDITDLKRAEAACRQAEEAVRQSEEHLRQVLDTLATFVGVMTPEGTFTRVNNASLVASGLAPEDVIGKKVWDCYWWNYDPKMQERVRESCARAAAGERLRYDAVVRMAGGRMMDIDFQIVPMFDSDGRVQFLIPSAVDITERKEKEAAVSRLNAELEQRVRERTAALEEANRELEGFTYSVSHDLRAPLRHMAGFAQMLEKSAAGKLDEVSQRQLSIVIDSANHTGKLMDQLLAFSRMGRASLRPQPVDLNRMVSEALRALEPDVQGRSIRWIIGAFPKVLADPELLRLVLNNLISNAVKFTRNCPEAVIEIGSERCERETVVWVRDNGAGFDPQYTGKLFGVFQRLHHADQFEGTGIGLANVRRIVSRHGGRTWAEGAINKGAAFFFSLPNA